MTFASTSCVGMHDLWSTLDDYERAGIRRVELGACRLDSPAHLADRLRDRPNQYLIHNYFPPPEDPFVLNLASPDDATRARSLALARQAIELASDLEAPFYSVHAGFVFDPEGFDGESFVMPERDAADATGAATSRFDRSIETILPHADRYGVRLLVENNVCLPRHRGLLLLQTADELDAFFGRFATPTLGLLLDTGHLRVTATTFGFDMDDFVSRVAPWVGALHVHDNDGMSDLHHPAAPTGWIADLITRPEFVDVLVCVEAHVDSAIELAEHVATLDAIRERRVG